jgi:arsenate reductase-like glutaredoxin family protein
MASRDRLKNGKEAETIRQLLADRLKKSELNEIYKQRKDSFSAETSNANDILKSFSKDLPLNPEMLKLLKQTFKLEEYIKNKKDEKKKEG